MITQSFDLNLIPDSAPIVVHCDQYDTGTGRLVISLYEGEMPYTPSGSATIQGSKPDGKGFEYDASISGNVVTANLTEQMSAVAGRVRCQIVVTETTGRTGTFVFILDVQPSALPLDTDLSESDYQLIEQAIEAAEDAQEYSEDAEAWAVGERGGVPVDPSDETFHNNSKWWAEQSAGGATSFADLTDVSLSNLTNGQIPQYNSTSQKWENKNLPTVPDDLNDLSDVSLSSSQNGQALIYDSTSSKWKNQNIPSVVSDLNDLGDVSISSLSNGQVLEYNSGTNKWENASLPSIPDEITDMSDVSVSSVQNGQVLKYNTTSQKWENANESGGGASDLDDLDDVTITSPTNGQALLYDSANQIWVNGNVSGGSGDYVGLYGMTEIQSSDGQGTTDLDLDTYTTIGNYYCNGKGKISLDILSYINGPRTQYFTTTKSGAEFLLYVRTLPNGDHIQTIYLDNYSDASSYIVAERRSYMFNGNRIWTHWAMYPSERQSSMGTNVNMPLGGLNNVTLSSVANGDALIYDSSATEWKNKPINKVTSLAVDLTGWTSDTTSQSGTTLYKKQISVNHVYVESPTVDIGSSGVLPTVAEQESYNLLQYVTVDDTVPCLYLYSSAIPTTAFYISVVGVD